MNQKDIEALQALKNSVPPELVKSCKDVAKAILPTPEEAKASLEKQMEFEEAHRIFKETPSI